MRGCGKEITNEEADWTLDSAPVEGSLWAARRLLERGCTLWGWGRLWIRAGCGGVGYGAVGVGEILSCCKDLVVVPVVVVVLEGTVEWGELPVDDELGDDGMVPVSRAGVDALRRKVTVVDGVVVVGTSRRRAGVAHVGSEMALALSSSSSSSLAMYLSRCLALDPPFDPPPARGVPRQLVKHETSDVHTAIVMTLLDAPWTLAQSQILEHFSVDPAVGLSDQLAVSHALLYGRNGASFPLFLSARPNTPHQSYQRSPQHRCGSSSSTSSRTNLSSSSSPPPLSLSSSHFSRTPVTPLPGAPLSNQQSFSSSSSPMQSSASSRSQMPKRQST